MIASQWERLMNILQKCFCALLLMAVCHGTHAAGTLGVMDAWMRASADGGELEAYATLVNNGDARLRILTVQSDNFRMTSILNTIPDGGRVSERTLRELTLEPGQRLVLQPGGVHVRLMQPRQRVQAGDVVDVVFLLEDGTRVPTRFDVRAARG